MRNEEKKMTINHRNLEFGLDDFCHDTLDRTIQVLADSLDRSFHPALTDGIETIYRADG